MYRGLFRTVCSARRCAFNLNEATRCGDAAPAVFRLGCSVGVHPLSTSSTSYCDNKDNAPPTPPQLNDKEDVQKGGDPLATPTEQGKEEKAAVECEVTKLPEQGKTPSKTSSTTAGGDGQKMEQKQQNVKSEKKSLLDLLGAMKVEVTTTKKHSKGQKSPPSQKFRPAATEKAHSMFQKATEPEASVQRESLSPQLAAAVSAAAASLPNPSQAESELLKQLRRHETVAEDHKKGEAKNIGTIISDMKVGRPASRPQGRNSNQIHFDEDGRGYTFRRSLFERRRLGIFSPNEETTDSAIEGPTLWDIEFANQLVWAANQMPRNGFEEMIQWTKEGKLWQYPIDNEAGLEEEAAVPFHEHIFLDRHLEEGFPLQGPVRHFMELVVAGLSRNPHLTVRQKTEHIAWYRDYFQEKEDVLKEAEVFLN